MLSEIQLFYFGYHLSGHLYFVSHPRKLHLLNINYVNMDKPGFLMH
jgi:hypothetical protein